MTTTIVDAAEHAAAYPWCVRCNVIEHGNGAITVEHYGEPLILPAPEGRGMSTDPVLAAEIYLDDQFSAPFLWIKLDEEREEIALDGDQLDTFIASLDHFRAGLAARRQQIAARKATRS